MNLDEISRIASLWCAGKPFVRRAWIFGSRARGTNRADSDIDIALDVIGVLRFEDGYTAFFNDHLVWQQDIQKLFTLRVHLSHYNESYDRLIDKSTPDIRPKVDNEGKLIYPTTI